MQVRINTDRHIEADPGLTRTVEASVRDALERFSGRITRVEVHLSDENSDNKAGAKDKRCLLEVRLAGLKPITVSHDAPSIDLAVDGATERMKRSLTNTLGRLNDR